MEIRRGEIKRSIVKKVEGIRILRVRVYVHRSVRIQLC